MIQLRISSQPTRAETNTQPATLNLQSQPAQLGITTEAATLEISQPQGTLSIDNYPCRAAIGILNSADLNRSFAQDGLQAAQELTAQYVQDGNLLASDIASGESTVPQLAAEHASTSQLDITWAYVPLPDISYQMNPAQISWNPAQLHFQNQPPQLQGDYTPGKIDARVTQYASVSITTAETGNAVDIAS